MKTYFDKPTQVQFWDYEEGQYAGGIAYRDEIICGCCGSIFEIEDIIHFTGKEAIPIIPFDDWVSLTEEIIGK